METKAAQKVYEEFDPYCKWQRSEDKDVLEIHLKEFKKDNLRVQISNHGILKISGEREVDPSTNSRFYKEVPASRQNYDTKAILAKFVNGVLFITLPKTKQLPETSATQPPPPPPVETPKKPVPKPDDQSKAATPVQPPRQTDGGQIVRESGGRGRGRSAMTKVAVTLAALAVLLAYVVYTYKTTAGEAED